MPDFLASADLIAALAIFVIVALATISLALLWEGVRRWLRSRAASRVLQKVAQKEEQAAVSGDAKPSTILQTEGDVAIPPWLEPIFLRLPHREDLQRLLDRAGSRWSVGAVLLGSVGAAVGLGLVAMGFTRGAIMPVLAAAAGAYLPIAVLKVKATRRMAAFEEHFPESIDLLARAARAGHSLAAGLEVVSQEAEEPVSSEFRQVYEEQRFGLPMKDALLGLGDRVDLVDVRIFVTAVLIQRESGGNLAENLDGLSRVIRERFKFKRDVKTKTAHGRMTGLVVAGAPFVAGIGMYAMNPDYMEPLLVEPLGQMMLLVGGVMMVTGFLVIRRIVDIKV